MSKSDPNSAIFMEDSAKDVENKINKGYCPEKEIDKNPIIDYTRYIIFPAFDNKFPVSIRQEDGSKVEKLYTSYEQLEADYTSGNLHPSDLKPAVAKAINKLLQPVRDHFENDPYARNLLEMIKRWQAELTALR